MDACQTSSPWAVVSVEGGASQRALADVVIAETVGVAVEVEHDGAVKEALDGNVAERRSKEARSPSSQSRPSDRPR